MVTTARAALLAGCNQHGQLGVGATANVTEPQALRVARRWAALSFGEGHAVGVTGQVREAAGRCSASALNGKAGLQDEG